MNKAQNNSGQLHQTERIEVTIRYQFNNKESLWQVIKSGQALMQGKTLDESGDRLFFLGEAVLQLIAADCCYEQPQPWIKFLDLQILGELTDQLDVKQWIELRVDRPESWGKERAIQLGKFMQLLTGMIYLDCNFYQVRDWFLGQVIGIDNPIIPADRPNSQEPYRDLSHLGRSVVNLIATDYLYTRFPGVPPEVLSHIREGCKEKMLSLGQVDHKLLGKNYVKGKYDFFRNKFISLIQKAQK